MYCPKCAAQNHDQTNFCRSCGAELKIVALAMNGQLALTTEVNKSEERKVELTQQSLKLQADGIQSAVKGMLFFMASVLMGVAFWLFSSKDWMIMWLLFCGWFASWGVIPMWKGLSKLIQARMLRRAIDLLPAAMTAPAAPLTGTTRETPVTAAIPEVSTSSSVTEHTTTPLMNPHLHS